MLTWTPCRGSNGYHDNQHQLRFDLKVHSDTPFLTHCLAYDWKLFLIICLLWSIKDWDQCFCMQHSRKSTKSIVSKHHPLCSPIPSPAMTSQLDTPISRLWTYGFCSVVCATVKMQLSGIFPHWFWPT